MYVGLNVHIIVASCNRRIQQKSAGLTSKCHAAQVREIYETAIEAAVPYGLADADCKRMCLRYAALERRLGEIDRARAILVHASSLADPRADPGFWKEWNDFEVAHGNEDTFRRALHPSTCTAENVLLAPGFVRNTDRLNSARMADKCGVAGREMLRIKRSVAASFSQIHYNTTIVEAATTPAATGAACCTCSDRTTA